MTYDKLTSFLFLRKHDLNRIEVKLLPVESNKTQVFKNQSKEHITDRSCINSSLVFFKKKVCCRQKIPVQMRFVKLFVSEARAQNQIISSALMDSLRLKNQTFSLLNEAEILEMFQTCTSQSEAKQKPLPPASQKATVKNSHNWGSLHDKRETQDRGLPTGYKVRIVRKGSQEKVEKHCIRPKRDFGGF